MCKREHIIAEMHSTLGNVGSERLYQALSTIYHWLVLHVSKFELFEISKFRWFFLNFDFLDFCIIFQGKKQTIILICVHKVM